MKANNTGETNIKVVGNIFRLTFVFNALKPSLNLCLSSPIALDLFLIFEIRGVLSIKTCLEGGNLVKLNHACTMIHHGMPLQHLLSNHMQSTSMGGQPRLCFVGISWRHVRQGSMEVSQRENIKWKE
jgi:hypothetical protein